MTDLKSCTVGGRRIMTINCIREGFDLFHTMKANLISHFFHKMGLSLSLNSNHAKVVAVAATPGCSQAYNLGHSKECLPAQHNFAAQHNFVAYHSNSAAQHNFVAQHSFVAQYNFAAQYNFVAQHNFLTQHKFLTWHYFEA